MRTLFLESIFARHFADAIFNTLLHSLWTGVLMALLAGMIMIGTRKSGAQARYQLLTGLMFLFLLTQAIIFIGSFSDAQETASGVISEISGIWVYETSGNLQQTQGWAGTLQQFFTQYSSWFVLIWFCIIGFKTLQLLFGVSYLRKIKSLQVEEAELFWRAKLEVLCAAINLDKPVRLLKSATAAVPMAIGFFKPVILIPAALFNAMTPAEIEAIILHELAHIRRHDFLVNIVQRLAEIIFFFNPAVLWVSDLIRREREYCCDDLAIGVTNDKKQYVQALVSFQEFQLQYKSPEYALAFPGPKNQIFNRVSRIINNNNKSLNAMEKIILASVIVISTIATVAFAQQKNRQAAKETIINTQNADQGQEQNSLQKPSASSSESQENPVAGGNNKTRDTVPDPVEVKHSTISEYSTKYKGKTYELTKKEGRLIGLKIDNKEIPASQFPSHQAELDSIDARIALKQRQLEHELEALAQYHKYNLAEKEFALDNEKLNKMLREQELAGEHNLLNKQLLNDQLAKELEFKMQYELKSKFPDTLGWFKLDQSMLNQKEMLNEEMLRKIKTQIDLSNQHQELLNQKLFELKSLEVELDKSFNEEFFNQKHLIEQTMKVREQEGASALIDELYEAGVIRDKHNIRLKLNNTELIVNGKKQSAELHQRLLKMMQKVPGDKVSFEYNLTH